MSYEMEKAWSDYSASVNYKYHAEGSFKDGWRARAAKAESDWVKIEDIPEEWKDGRTLDLWIIQAPKYAFRLTDCTWGYEEYGSDAEDCFYDDWGNPVSINGNITHAMLPPQPPTIESKKNEK
jgi:hypothetical protein